MEECGACLIMNINLTKLLTIAVVGLGAAFLSASGEVQGSEVMALFGFILGYVFKNGKDLVSKK